MIGLMWCIVAVGGIYIHHYVSDEDHFKEEKPVVPCNCVSYEQYTYRQNKYDFYVDKSFVAKPKDTARLKDSVDKYARLLKF